MKKVLIIASGFMLLLAVFLLVLPAAYLSSQRQFEEVSIQGEGYQLHGYISEAADTSGDWIVLVHGNRKSGQQHDLYEQIRGNLPGEYSVFAVDLRGFGGSVGDSENQLPASIDRSVDLSKVKQFLSDNYGTAENQIILIGHSFGAAQVLNVAQTQRYQSVIPIGLGDWDALLASDAEIDSYMDKFYANTGIQVDRSILIKDAENFTMQALSKGCPASPVWFIYASQDDAKNTHEHAFQSLVEKCPGQFAWSQIPLSDHMYGTEMDKLPGPLRGFYSRMSLSLLKYRLGQILGSMEV